jgi:hypothetical protein
MKLLKGLAIIFFPGGISIAIAAIAEYRREAKFKRAWNDVRSQHHGVFARMRDGERN